MVPVRFQWKKITAGSLDAKKMSTLANGDGHYTNIVLHVLWYVYNSYMQKTCDVAEKAILAKKNLRKKCANRDKSA